MFYGMRYGRLEFLMFPSLLLLTARIRFHDMLLLISSAAGLYIS